MRKWECTVCGYIHEGDAPPDECPVCAADKSMFVEITDEVQAVGSTAAGSSNTTSKPSLLDTVQAIGTRLILKHHLHPITVHTPNGIIPMAVLFSLITALFGYQTFETAAFYSLIFVLIVMPAVLITGYTVWQERYRGAMTTVFKIKIGASAVTVLSLVILIIWRIANPNILTAPTSGRWLYIALAVIMLAAVGLAGHIGGKLVFGSRKN